MKDEETNYMYSLAEASEMVTETGLTGEEFKVGVIMFATLQYVQDIEKIKLFTGYGDEVEACITKMKEIGIIDGEYFVCEWQVPSRGGIAFMMDVLSVCDYFIVSYNDDGERQYQSNKEKPYTHLLGI